MRLIPISKIYLVSFLLGLFSITPVVDCLAQSVHWQENALKGKSLSNLTDAVFSDLYPIGFSRDGKFAFIKRDESFDPFWRIVVLNLVTDEHVRDVMIEDPEGKMTFKQFAVTQKAEINAAIFEEAIQEKAISLQKFPFSWSGDTYSLAVSTEDILLAEEFAGYRHSVLLRSEKLGEKKITEFETSQPKCYPAACFKSPFEDRLAVVIVTEGNMLTVGNMVDFRIIGAHLKYGFKPEADD